MTGATSSFRGRPHGLRAGEATPTARGSESGVAGAGFAGRATPTAWGAGFEIAGFGESIFLGAAPTALRGERRKVAGAGFAAGGATPTVGGSGVGGISA